MARLWSSGFELNTLTNGVEFDIIHGTQATYSSLVKRSGSYSGHVSGLTSGLDHYFRQQFASSNNTVNFHSSAWTQATLDSMQIGAVTGTIGVSGIQLTTIWALVDYSLGNLSVNVSDTITASESVNPALTFNVHVEPEIQMLTGIKIV